MDGGKKRARSIDCTLEEQQSKVQRQETRDFSSMIAQLMSTGHMLASVDILDLINIISTCKTYHSMMKKHIEELCCFLYQLTSETPLRVYAKSRNIMITDDSGVDWDFTPVPSTNDISLTLPRDGFPSSATHLFVGIYETNYTTFDDLLSYFREDMKFGEYGTYLRYSPTGLKYDAFNIPINLKFSVVTHLILGNQFDQSIDNLPDTLTHLILGEVFNQSVDKLPSNLKVLSLQKSTIFDQPIDYLPESLTHLHLNHAFNQSVDFLPENLTYLIFGKSFNRDIQRLPSTITHLVLDMMFNQPINKLPKELLYLRLGEYFNRSLEKHLPSKLIHLDLVKCKLFNHGLHHLPDSVVYLAIHPSWASGSLKSNFRQVPPNYIICHFVHSAWERADAMIVENL